MLGADLGFYNKRQSGCSMVWYVNYMQSALACKFEC